MNVVTSNCHPPANFKTKTLASPVPKAWVQLMAPFVKNLMSALLHPSEAIGYAMYRSGLRASTKTAFGGVLWADSYSELKTAKNLALSLNELGLVEAIPDHGCVFDIGSHVGIWTVPIALRRPHASIYSFEGAPSTFRRLQENVLRNGIAHVHLHHCAVSDSIGTVSFQSPANASVFGRIAATGNSRGRYHKATLATVPCTTIDEFCSRQSIERIDFMKVDVEGAELSVLRGAYSMLSAQKIRTIWMEVDATNQEDFGSSVSAIADLLHSVGYGAYRISAPNDPVDIRKGSDGNMLLKPSC